MIKDYFNNPEKVARSHDSKDDYLSNKCLLSLLLAPTHKNIDIFANLEKNCLKLSVITRHFSKNSHERWFCG